jgi:hypothetical protein
MKLKKKTRQKIKEKRIGNRDKKNDAPPKGSSDSHMPQFTSKISLENNIQ